MLIGLVTIASQYQMISNKPIKIRTVILYSSYRCLSTFRALKSN